MIHDDTTCDMSHATHVTCTTWAIQCLRPHDNDTTWANLRGGTHDHVATWAKPHECQQIQLLVLCLPLPFGSFHFDLLLVLLVLLVSLCVLAGRLLIGLAPRRGRRG